MIGLRVKMPFASWRDEFARQYRQTHPVPPPATCYGFLLSLVGETDSSKYHGNRVSAGLVKPSEKSIVIRKIRRIGKSDVPDHQELFTDVDLVVWVHGNLEGRVKSALTHPEDVVHFGGLSLGESSFLVDTVSILGDNVPATRTFLLGGRRRITLPVIADHNTNEQTEYAIGDIEEVVGLPDPERLPVIKRS
jgi:CRISPR-associated protein Cas5t